MHTLEPASAAHRSGSAWPILAGVAVAALAVRLLTAGFPSSGGGRAPAGSVSGPSPVTILVGWQVDGSLAMSARQRLVGLFKSVFDRDLPDGSRIAMWCFNGASWQIYDGVPASWTALWNPLRQQVLTTAGGAAAGVSPCEMLHEMTRRARGRRAAIVLCTNGSFSDYDAARACVGEMAAEKGVAAVWVVGMQPDPVRGEELRRRVAAVFAPLGDRLVESGAFDALSGRDRFAALLRRGCP